MNQPPNDETAAGGLAKTYSPADIEARRYSEWERSGAFACDPADATRAYYVAGGNVVSAPLREVGQQVRVGCPKSNDCLLPLCHCLLPLDDVH